MRASVPWLAAVLLVGIGLVAPAGTVATGHVTFDQPEATARLGQPIVFQTTLQAVQEPTNVELLVNLPAQRAVTVVSADVIRDGGSWRAAAVLPGQLTPNTRLSFRFRSRDGDETVLGPVAETLLVDDRFEWRTMSNALVNLHWYEGDERFAQRALDIGERAIERASELLGVTETPPIDFFIYTAEADLREALGPGTRENVGGQAHSDIRTLFGLIEPHEIESDWVDELVIHELTHIVFDTATDNPYRSPPRWLNEGVAVLLSEGYTPGWQAAVELAADDGSLIPLDGLAGLFPTTQDRFFLAYAESVSAVDFFIRTYDEPTLWALVRSYADGVSDDEAFRAATNEGLADFNQAWMESLGAAVPEPAGPMPGPAGPLPPGWDPDGEPAPAPTGAPPATGTPDGRSPEPGSPGPTSPPRPATTPTSETTSGGNPNFTLGLLLALIVVAGIVVVAFVSQRSGTPRPPPP